MDQCVHHACNSLQPIHSNEAPAALGRQLRATGGEGMCKVGLVGARTDQLGASNALQLHHVRGACHGASAWNGWGIRGRHGTASHVAAGQAINAADLAAARGTSCYTFPGRPEQYQTTSKMLPHTSSSRYAASVLICIDTQTC